VKYIYSLDDCTARTGEALRDGVEPRSMSMICRDERRHLIRTGHRTRPDFKVTESFATIRRDAITWHEPTALILLS